MPTTLHVNLDDPVQVDALFQACTWIKTLDLPRAEIVGLATWVANTHGDGIAANRERREVRQEYGREGRNGWT